MFMTGWVLPRLCVVALAGALLAEPAACVEITIALGAEPTTLDPQRRAGASMNTQASPQPTIAARWRRAVVTALVIASRFLLLVWFTIELKAADQFV